MSKKTYYTDYENLLLMTVMSLSIILGNAVFSTSVYAGSTIKADGVSNGVSQTLPYRKTSENYSIPELKLTRMDGKKVPLATLFDSDKLIILNFVFTTCPSICPIMSATFASVQKKLADESIQPQLISISIDPEEDRPDKLREYAKRFHAGKSWDFFTGDYSDIVTVQRAFNAYRGDKMSHQQLVFMHAPKQATWIRLEGFISANDLIREYRNLKLK